MLNVEDIFDVTWSIASSTCAPLVVVRKPRGQGAVTPPVLGGGAVAWGERWGEEGALQVLLEQLASNAGLSCRD